MAFSIVQARALDHGQSQSRAAKPAGTEFSSVVRMALVGRGG
jgi:hypothetical protein